MYTFASDVPIEAIDGSGAVVQVGAELRILEVSPSWVQNTPPHKQAGVLRSGNDGYFFKSLFILGIICVGN